MSFYVIGIIKSKDIEKTFKDLINAGVSQLTIGQYLRPSPKHYEVKKFYTNKEFEELKDLAISYGFKAVVSGNLIRSSFYADKLWMSRWEDEIMRIWENKYKKIYKKFIHPSTHIPIY